MTARLHLSMAPSASPAVGLAIGAMVAIQLASALARPLMAEIGAPALTWLRMSAAAVLLLLIVRPNLRGLTREAIGAAVLLGGALGLMSAATFSAVSHLPLGLVATIAFLGPLGVAVMGARGAMGRAMGYAALAGLGVVLMLATGLNSGGTGWHVNALGLGLALLGAAGWAAYILLTRRVGALFKGNDGLCLSLMTASLILAPAGLTGLAGAGHMPSPGVILGAAALGLLAPTMTCWLEMKALRSLGTQSFGILMSLEPAIATLLGLAILHETPNLMQLAGMACVVAASAGTVFLPVPKRRAKV